MHSESDDSGEDAVDETEMKKFVKDVEDSILNEEELSRKLAHGIFVGPPGSGKSSLMDRLLGRKREKEFSPSTGISDQIVVVHINESNPTTFHAVTVVDEDQWEEMEYGLSLINQIDEGIKPLLDPLLPVEPVVFQSPEPKSSSLTTSTFDRLSFQSLPKSQHDNSRETKVPKVKTARFSLAIDREVFESLVKKHRNYKKFKHFLKKSFSLYLRDTGGQVEFQEMLCLLVCGPSIFFFVFRLDVDFKKKFQIEYRESDGTCRNCYTSSVTTEEALLQSLASIYAMDTPGDAGVKTHKPLVFIFGTHRDKLGANASMKIAELDHYLHDLIRNSGFEDLVEFADRDKVMFTVDNTSGDDEDFKVIRSRIQSLIRGRNDFTIKYPISYLLFSLELQNQNHSVLTFEECQIIAAKYGIVGEKLLHLLEFLHLRVGVIRYFNKKGVRHIVIKEPQVLFNKVTDLIVRTFSSKALYTRELNEFEKKGILTEHAFDCVVTNEDDIKPKDFLHILEHLRLIASYITPRLNEKCYFIPSVLNHVSESYEEELETSVLPLAVKFKCNHCPKGLFGVLVTHFMSPETNRETDATTITTFALKEDKVFKDQVSFDVISPGVEDEVSLKAFPSHLEINFYPDHTVNRLSSVETVCSNVRLILEAAIHRSLRDLHYNESRVKPAFCMMCKKCFDFHQVKKEAEYYQMRCTKHRMTISIPSEGKYWYDEGKCYHCMHPIQWTLDYPDPFVQGSLTNLPDN